jgi:superfamily II DNA helicase RecQ
MQAFNNPCQTGKPRSSLGVNTLAKLREEFRNAVVLDEESEGELDDVISQLQNIQNEEQK